MALTAQKRSEGVFGGNGAACGCYLHPFPARAKAHVSRASRSLIALFWTLAGRVHVETDLVERQTGSYPPRSILQPRPGSLVSKEGDLILLMGDMCQVPLPIACYSPASENIVAVSCRPIFSTASVPRRTTISA